MNIRNLTLEEINSAPAIKIAEWLSEYQKWRRGIPPYECGGDKMPFVPSELGDIINRAIELLGKPLRNCDVGTAEEQSKRFKKYCALNKCFEWGCEKCPIFPYKIIKCEFIWSLMPYKKGEVNE